MADLTASQVLETYATLASAAAIADNSTIVTLGTVELGDHDIFDKTADATSFSSAVTHSASEGMAIRVVVDAAAAVNTIITMYFDYTYDGTNWFTLDYQIAVTDALGVATPFRVVLPRIPPSATKLRVRAGTSEAGGSTLTSVKVKLLGAITGYVKTPA